MKNRDLETYLKKFQFKSIPAELKNKIMTQLENQYTQQILWIDKLWNWKYALSIAAVTIFFITFNLYVTKYAEKMIPIVCQEKKVSMPDIETLLAFLDKDSKASLWNWLEYIQQEEKIQGKSLKDYRDYILEIKKLTS